MCLPISHRYRHPLGALLLAAAALCSSSTFIYYIHTYNVLKQCCSPACVSLLLLFAKECFFFTIISWFVFYDRNQVASKRIGCCLIKIGIRSHPKKALFFFFYDTAFTCIFRELSLRIVSTAVSTHALEIAPDFAKKAGFRCWFWRSGSSRVG